MRAVDERAQERLPVVLERVASSSRSARSSRSRWRPTRSGRRGWSRPASRRDDEEEHQPERAGSSSSSVAAASRPARLGGDRGPSRRHPRPPRSRAGRGVLRGVEEERVRRSPVRARPRRRGEEPACGRCSARRPELLAPRHPDEVLGADADEADVGDHAARERVAGRVERLARRRRSKTFSGRIPTQPRSPVRVRRGRPGRRPACPCMSTVTTSRGSRRRPCPRSGWTGRGSSRRTSCAGSRRARPGRPSARSRRRSSPRPCRPWSWPPPGRG